MAVKKQEAPVEPDVPFDVPQPLAEPESLTPVDALEGEAELTVELDVGAFADCCDTISATFKSMAGLFNPADSRGDLFRNQIVLLDNQIAGLRALVAGDE